MKTTIYEGRANELNEQISYLLGALDNYDPVENAKERETILKQLMYLRRFEETNAKVLLEAESLKLDFVREEREAMLADAKANELNRVVDKIDVVGIVRMLLEVVLTFGVVRYEANPAGGFMPSDKVSRYLRMAHEVK